MYDFLELGPSPSDESCVQVSKGEYEDQMKDECHRYRQMLQKRFPFAEHMFRVRAFPHDYGRYYEVVILFWSSSEEENKIAWFVEDNLPATWDDDTIFEKLPEEDYQP